MTWILCRSGKGIIPEMSFALNGVVNYKAFDLNFLFQGASGFNYVDGGWFDRDYYGSVVVD